jgi:hypothetical protein
MKIPIRLPLILACAVTLHSCSVVEKSSRHGFESGYYKLDSGRDKPEDVYLDVSEEKIAVYPRTEDQVNKEIRMTVPFSVCDSLPAVPLKFIKKSLDIDITTILMKYRPAVHGLPAQLTTDFNVALYAGWRRDYYRLQAKKDPLGNQQCDLISRGFDFGLFAGTGTTYIDANNTIDPVEKEYNGFIIEYGMAGFLETSFVSFGISLGFDYLLSSDRPEWIFHQKPWVGFIIGIALN